jgi:hypothetical protein
LVYGAPPPAPDEAEPKITGGVALYSPYEPPLPVPPDAVVLPDAAPAPPLLVKADIYWAPTGQADVLPPEPPLLEELVTFTPTDPSTPLVPVRFVTFPPEAILPDPLYPPDPTLDDVASPPLLPEFPALAITVSVPIVNVVADVV